MRLSLLCVWTSWILTLHTAAQHHPHREEGGVQPGHRQGVRAGRRRQSAGRPTPPRPSRGTGAKLGGGQADGRGRAAPTGPHVCGDQCCVGWTLSPKTRRCTKPRCFPRCHNGALCRQSNRCVCRRGFHGSRCESSVPGQQLTSIHPTVIPRRPPVQFDPPRNPPEPTQRLTKPAQSHVTAARSGPAALLPPPAATAAARITQMASVPAILRAKTGASDLDPSSTPAETHNKEEDARIPNSGPAKFGNFGLQIEGVLAKAEDKGGVYKRFSMQEENQASLKGEEVKMKPTAEETPAQADTKPTSNNLQPWTGDNRDREEGAEVTEKTPNLSSDSESEVEEASQPNSEKRLESFQISDVESKPDTESLSGAETKGSSKTEGESVIQQSDSAQRSTTYIIPNLEANLKPKVERGEYLGSKTGSKVEDRPDEKTTIWSKLEESEGTSKSSQEEFDLGSRVEEQRPTSPGSDSRSDPGLRGQKSVDAGETRRTEEVKTGRAKKQTLSLREAQALLQRKTLSRGGRGDKMAALLMKHIEKERKKLGSVTSSSSASNSSSSPASSVRTSVTSFHTQKGQYTVHVTAATADGQTATGGRGRGGGGVERIQVMFTPTICKVRCSQERCVNYCERGNVTTLYSSSSSEGGGGRRDSSHGPGFRVFLCPLLCKNGGICLQKDRCLCPPQFTGKFCQIPVAPSSAAAAAAAVSPVSTNEIVKPAILSAAAANQELTRSEFLLPLGQNQGAASSGAHSPSMVKVRVQHPPEASVKIHQVLKVSGFSPTLRTLSSPSSSGSAGAPAPGGRGVQAQTLRGEGTYSQHSGFKYCFREVKDGQCSSPLPGLRSREMCCRGIGKGWGITDCVLCPDNTGQSNSSCPAGFERANGTQCVDVNECLQPWLCENGICVNTMGSYSCVCRAGFILDASHGICISQSVISEEKGQCYRVLGSGQGLSSCSLPILRNITKQICCCSRVGKAWGPDCQRCPYFGSVAFKEICPAGPGYHYSASVLQFNQRVTEQLGGRGAPLLTHSSQDNQGPDSGSSSSGASRAQQKPTSSGGTAGGASTPLTSASSVGSSAGSAGTSSTQTRPSLPQPQPGHPSQPQTRPAAGSPSTRPVQPGSTDTTATQDKSQTPGRPGTQQSQSESAPSFTTQQRPQPPSTGSQAGGRSSSVSRLDQPPVRGDSLPAPAQPQSPERGSRPSEELPPLQKRPAVSPTSRVQTVRSVCESRPAVCGRGRCLDQPGGKHTCVCDQGYQPNSQRTYCQDVNECEQSPGACSVGECVNTMGSYRCVCPSGYRSSSQQTSCQDIDECQLNLCRNGRCDNMPGSYRCVCGLGYRLTGNSCTDVDECEDPRQCPGQECINSQGSYRCASCQPGYGLLNRLCTDIDECRQAPCSNGRCENAPGSYRCVCHHGYELQNNTCADVDECAEPSQCPGQMCVNSVGSYRCVSCRQGYTLTNRQCTDVNECENSESCPGQRCVNSEGSYSCVGCQQGYHSVDGVCTDVDECVKPGVCLDGRCVNTEGSFQCQCQTGFTANPEKTTCLDVDECVLSGGSVCGSRRCENTIGSYRCLTSCEPGYQVTHTGNCVDINECANKTVCGDHAFCQNLIGTYLCMCDQGFTSTADGKACVDEDECVSLQGVCGSARCENVEGSFICECDGPGEFDTTTRTCVSTVQPAETVPSYPSFPFHAGAVELDPVPPPLPAARPGELRECYYNLSERGTCGLLASNTSQQECCCTVGEGWGLSCRYHACPRADTAEFLSLCPSGRGYVTTGPGAFSYRDVDECKRFHPEVCKNGVCVNNIPGYNCYCPSGYVYNSTLLECVDHDECEEESCVGGVCVNTVGSYYCSCQPPLVLDDTQRNCVNSSHLTVDENLSVCWQHLSADMMCQSPLLGAQFTFTDCCCLYGEGWGMECALCPSTDSEDHAFLCSSRPPPMFPSFPDSRGPDAGVRLGAGRGGASAPPHFPPYSPDSFPPALVPSRDFSRPDYHDYSPAGGSRLGFRGRTPASFSLPDGGYRRAEYGTGYYSEGDYGSPDGSPPRPPSFGLPADPRSETAFGAQPPPPSRPDGPPLSLAPLPGGPYEEQEEDEEEEEEDETWRPGPPFPSFTERRGGGGGGGAPWRAYERQFDSYASLSAAEDCGILHGCENGRCIRVAEGYTCDCYQGYELDMTSMTCIDVNECDDSVSLDFPCVNARCVNTEGSFRCVCRRGYVMSRRPNHCVAA
ncbi:latent-transforming growth factor beta-binding protein 1-like [Xiphias gladius]|uniref:latent-transforming growth factor beta-binding protein 1-like n=1 Tax=Xiphias gladius TaxID=8245 RepID=UPI001A9981F0|nr:latent-transforming growth factor beta-binding protein 1-like [Xiphias gladius]